jgi:hypothetical protein
MEYMTPTPDEAQIERVFFPFMEQKKRAVVAAGGRFVYYTTAETATKILKSKQFWMRNTTVMNDYMEVDHGFNCLHPAYNGPLGARFRAALDGCFPGVEGALLQHFNGWLATIRSDTYLTCLSEHDDTEDENGRLSMWRAYGGRAGVALVINGAVMSISGDPLGAYGSPVAYLDQKGFEAQFLAVVENIEREGEFVRSLGREKLRDIAFNMLRFAVLCTKHPGFHEEREWRVMASPTMYPSELMERTVEVVRGITQPVLRLPLRNRPEHSLVGLAPSEVLNRIIIGPCEFPQVMLAGFRQLLAEAQVAEPEKKVAVSGIPLRNL